MSSIDNESGALNDQEDEEEEEEEEEEGDGAIGEPKSQVGVTTCPFQSPTPPSLTTTALALLWVGLEAE